MKQYIFNTYCIFVIFMEYLKNKFLYVYVSKRITQDCIDLARLCHNGSGRHLCAAVTLVHGGNNPPGP